MDTSQLFRQRLRRDLHEIQANADHGFYVHPASDDMRRLCLHICPESGPFAYLRLHFSVELPSNYPASPPRVWSSVSPLQHPNILENGFVCCDIFRESVGGYSGTSHIGYTPAYTLRGICKQLYSLFSSKTVATGYASRGLTDLGDAKVTHFISEINFIRPFGSSRSLGEQGNPFSLFHAETERQLEKAWNADNSEEVVINIYQNETGGYVKQLTKKSMMRDLQESDLQVQVPGRVSTMRASSYVQQIFKFESRSPLWEKSLKRIQRFECNGCGYGSGEFAQYSPNGIMPTNVLALTGDDLLPYMVPAIANQLGRLKMDVLQLLCDYLPDESLHALSQAYKPVQQFLQRANFFRKRGLRCSYLGTQFRQEANPEKQPEPKVVLGLGIALDPKRNTLSSESLLDGFLSEEAFQKCGARQTARKKPFGFHLPLAMNLRHFQEIKPTVYEALANLHAEVTSNERSRRAEREYSGGPHRTRSTTSRRGAVPDYERGTTPVVSTRSAAQGEIESMNVLYKLVNDLVVNFKKSCEATLDAGPAATRYRSYSSSALDDDEPTILSLRHQAERFLPTYWQLFHLMLCICRDNPAIVQAAHDRVRQFIDCPDKRSKEYEPDLGELVVLAALVFACQDEGLLPLKPERPAGPARITRQRSGRNLQTDQASQNSQTNRLRNEVRQPYPAPNRSGSPGKETRDPIIRWSEHLAGPLLQEAMTRGVKQTLDASPELQWLEPCDSEYRLIKSFQHCRSSLRLLSLQISMFAVFSYFEHPNLRAASGTPPSTLAHLDFKFGESPPEAVTVLTEEVKATYRVSSWTEFFQKVQYEHGCRWNSEELSAGLRQCVLLSERHGYHINRQKAGDARVKLSRDRDRIEKEWKRNHTRRLKQLHG